MTSKQLTALEALELLKKLKKNNIVDQEVEDMLLDIIEKELKEHRLLKNIEKELEIDLITLFKALKDGINVYYEDIGRYKFRNNLRLEYHKTLGWGLVYIYGCSCRDDMPMKLDKEFYELKEYQKTWFLKEDSREEELKNE